MLNFTVFLIKDIACITVALVVGPPLYLIYQVYVRSHFHEKTVSLPNSCLCRKLANVQVLPENFLPKRCAKSGSGRRHAIHSTYVGPRLVPGTSFLCHIYKWFGVGRFGHNALCYSALIRSHE